MRLRRILLGFAAALVLSTAVGAQSAEDVTVTLDPAAAGKPSRLTVVASGEATSSGQEQPQSLSLFIARGFKVDPRSRAKRCSEQQRLDLSCPAESRVATGTAQGSATFFGQTFPFSATIEAFLAPRAQPGDIAGVAVVVREQSSGRTGSGKARLLRTGDSGPFGIELRFDEFPAADVPAGVTVKLDRLELSVKASRRVRVKRPRRKPRYRRYHLIRNPRECSGSWPFQARVQFPSSELVRDGSVACTG
jgi:hypothetical protein